ncbi:dTDP-4-dehydrorhamnose 3,5-epimerase [Shewanella olleyana]|uniref:dTDP-4-dehydrorhamnose 3,5-epimerase n=1 Tax=Shewanella olleyana TaxID=135626 RepID=UPI00200F9AF6|nr:dTDP-4-dehydrorhamnose 3,5-epimerase [Shewanella olleyana]MCL1067055.1 dTDP-4-dehydrorhamnose 3,5-epimerase [Shewanella olleyana]
MKIIETSLADVKIIEPQVFNDDRGFFYESFQAERYQKALNIPKPFVQSNVSQSKQGVLRGLHFQRQQPQGKLISIISGSIFDVAVDLRRDSENFGKWIGVELSAENKRQVWIPEGFAHGFVTLSELADVEYKCTDYYAPQHEASLLWNDSDLAIGWPVKSPILSEKDQLGLKLKDLKLEELQVRHKDISHINISNINNRESEQ